MPHPHGRPEPGRLLLVAALTIVSSSGPPCAVSVPTKDAVYGADAGGAEAG
jgi:hypothetical protein